MSKLSILPFVCVASLALAQTPPNPGPSGVSGNQGTSPSTTQTPEPPPYQPKRGEQPEFGKKYYTDQETHDAVIEVNPLLLLKPGLGIETEFRVSDVLTIGGDLRFLKEKYTKIGVYEPTETIFGIGPKIRIYPKSNLNGIFVGAKLLIGMSTMSLGNGEKDKSSGVITPNIHLGYRFSQTVNHLTIGLYLGGDANMRMSPYQKADLSAAGQNSGDAVDAADSFNKNFLRPDFGLTIGAAL